jgi:hypothetical protein
MIVNLAIALSTIVIIFAMTDILLRDKQKEAIKTITLVFGTGLMKTIVASW